MFLKLLLKVLTTEAAKQLVVYAATELAKRTDNDIDDTAVRLIAKTLGVAAPAVEVTRG